MNGARECVLLRSEVVIRFCIPRRVSVTRTWNCGLVKGGRKDGVGEGDGQGERKKRITRLADVSEGQKPVNENEPRWESQPNDLAQPRVISSLAGTCLLPVPVHPPVPPVSCLPGTGCRRWLQLIGCSFHSSKQIISLQGGRCRGCGRERGKGVSIALIG